jgi:16S rRNA (cytidine1402-2'-O)-methyltransferase
LSRLLIFLLCIEEIRVKWDDLSLRFSTMTTLYLVPTPLGDPDDITLRALRILREASAVAAAEFDTARLLLDAHSITTQIIAYSDVFEAMKAGDVALVANAGTPGIGDAAQEIVREAIARGIRVEPLPGADAAITALVLSGLPTDAFVYVGKMPDDLSAYTQERETMIFASHDLMVGLKRLLEALGNRRICVSWKLTHPDQLIAWSSLSDALRVLDWGELQGDVMLVVAGAAPEVEAAWDEARVRAALREKLEAGEPLKLVAKAVAGVSGWDRRTVYALGVEEKRNQP